MKQKAIAATFRHFPYALACLLVILQTTGCSLTGQARPVTSEPIAAANTTPVSTEPPASSPVANSTGFSSDDVQQNQSQLKRNWTPANQIPILMYHSISHNPKNTLCVDPLLFEQEMEHLSQAHYTPVTFADLNTWAFTGKLPDKPVLITFDDGYKDNYLNAFPALKTANMKATIFLITGFIGSKNSLSWDEIDEMQHSGLVEFGSHTVSHLDLDKLPAQLVHEQVFDSKEVLDKHFGSNTIAFCYPAGRYNQQTVNEVKNAGYEFAVTTHPGKAKLVQGNYTLDRVRISGSLTLPEFENLFP